MKMGKKEVGQIMREEGVYGPTARMLEKQQLKSIVQLKYMKVGKKFHQLTIILPNQ